MRNSFIRLILCAVSSQAVIAMPVRGQDLGAVESLFKEVSAVTVFYQWGGVTSDRSVTSNGLNGAGTEVLIDLNSAKWNLELGLGASFLRGYEAVEPSLDLRTSLRSLPTVSLYATPLSWKAVDVYGGLSFGLVELWNAQAYDTERRAWDLTARTFEYGFSGGMYWRSSVGVALFAEAGYRHREFPSIKWTLPDEQTLPASWPRTLDFSGYQLQVGAQLRVKKDDKNETITLPAPAGVWTLEKVNGAAPPGVLDSTREGKTELVHAVLRLVPGNPNSYELDMNVRTTSAAGAVTVDTPRETGSYTRSEAADTRKHILTFTGGEARSAERLAGRLYVNWKGHVLTFAPGNAAPASK